MKRIIKKVTANDLARKEGADAFKEVLTSLIMTAMQHDQDSPLTPYKVGYVEGMERALSLIDEVDYLIEV